MPRLQRPPLVLLAVVLALVTVPPLLVQTARLSLGGTVLLPGAAVADGYLVPGTRPSCRTPWTYATAARPR